MPRQKPLLVLLSLLLPVNLLSAGVFKGAPTRVSSSVMTIRWETSDESSAREFVVVRREFRSGGMGPWDVVGQVRATGNGSVYQLEDSGIFKTADRVLEYEVRAVDAQGYVLEIVRMSTVFPSGLTSAVRRTWGSIKAMFR